MKLLGHAQLKVTLKAHLQLNRYGDLAGQPDIKRHRFQSRPAFYPPDQSSPIIREDLRTHSCPGNRDVKRTLIDQMGAVAVKRRPIGTPSSSSSGDARSSQPAQSIAAG